MDFIVQHPMYSFENRIAGTVMLFSNTSQRIVSPHAERLLRVKGEQ
jgi:hypothetical protein